MKDYFSFINTQQVTGVTNSDSPSNNSKINDLTLSPVVTLAEYAEVPAEHREIAVLPPSPPVTPEIMYCQKQYQERIAHELRFTSNRAQAENLAYQEVVLRWINDHPTSLAESICAGCGKPITATQESIAYGGICTHWHGGDLARGFIARGTISKAGRKKQRQH